VRCQTFANTYFDVFKTFTKRRSSLDATVYAQEIEFVKTRARFLAAIGRYSLDAEVETPVAARRSRTCFEFAEDADLGKLIADLGDGSRSTGLLNKERKVQSTEWQLPEPWRGLGPKPRHWNLALLNERTNRAPALPVSALAALAQLLVENYETAIVLRETQSIFERSKLSPRDRVSSHSIVAIGDGTRSPIQSHCLMPPPRRIAPIRFVAPPAKAR